MHIIPRHSAMAVVGLIVLVCTTMAWSMKPKCIPCSLVGCRGGFVQCATYSCDGHQVTCFTSSPSPMFDVWF
jgi:hypothetical protein